VVVTGQGRSSLLTENCAEPLPRKAVREFLTELDFRDVTLSADEGHPATCRMT